MIEPAKNAASFCIFGINRIGREGRESASVKVFWPPPEQL